MIIDIKTPPFAESIAEGTVLEWQKRVGDAVKRGDRLVDIETDKVVLEVSAPEDGLLRAIQAETGATVSSEQPLASLDTEYGAQEAAMPVAPPQVMARSEPLPETPSGEPAMSPGVRRLAAARRVDPQQLQGTGPKGRVTRDDVLARSAASTAPAPPDNAAEPYPAAGAAGLETAAEQTPSRPAAAGAGADQPRSAATGTSAAVADADRRPTGTGPDRWERREPMSRIRARIAERLVQVQRETAHLSTFNEVDVSAIQALRQRYRESFERTHGVRLGYLSFFVRAAVQALQRFPVVNARIDGPEIVYHDYYDIGIAVSSPRGLVVPVLRDADRASFAEVERRIADFGERARNSKLLPEDLGGGTFTITNGGVFGSLLSTPIINPPQSAILGMHKIQDRPVAVDGQVVIRPMMYLALSYDHRLIDGRDAVLFLVALKEVLEDPARLLLQV